MLAQIAWQFRLAIVVEVFRVVVSDLSNPTRKTARVYLLSIVLTTCLVQPNFCFRYSTITSFTQLHSRIDLLIFCRLYDWLVHLEYSLKRLIIQVNIDFFSKIQPLINSKSVSCNISWYTKLNGERTLFKDHPVGRVSNTLTASLAERVRLL